MEVNKPMVNLLLTCPLCNNIVKYATTITECLHTFCRECIHNKLTEEKLNTCPVCNVDLGCAPLEKLKLDHMLEQLIRKIYRPRREKITPPIDTIASSSNKTNSLSSSHISGLPKPVLLNSTSKDEKLADEKEHASLEPNVPGTKVLNGPIRKSRKGKKKVSKAAKNDTKLDLSMVTRERSRNKVESDSNNRSSSKIVSNIEQDNEPESLTHNDKATSSKGSIQNKNEEFPNLSDLLNALNCSAKSEEKHQNSKRNDKKTIFLSDQQATGVGKPKESVENNQSKVFTNSNGNLSKTSCDKSKEINGESSSSRVGLRPRKCKKSYIENTDSDSDVAEVIRTLQDTENDVTGRNVPIWFTLIASENTDEPLPQISPRYLRVKDGNLPVLYIQKYIAKKLNLASEAEVVIWLRHEPVPSSQQLHNLLDWWVQTTPVSERTTSTVGSSAADFVMKLFYSRKSHL